MSASAQTEIAVLCELDNKAYYERYALTPEEFSNMFADRIAKGMPLPRDKGDSWTLRPMVHIWYRTAEVNSPDWETFFTDMADGIPDSDIECGNLAYVCSYHAVSFRDKLLKYEQPAIVL